MKDLYKRENKIVSFSKLKKNDAIVNLFRKSFLKKATIARKTGNLLILIYNTGVNIRRTNRKFSMDCVLFPFYT